MNTAIQEYIIPENMKVVQQSTFKNCQNSRMRFNVLIRQKEKKKNQKNFEKTF